MVGRWPDKLWYDNGIQFPRLIAELESVGAFTPEIVIALSKSMDLTRAEVWELILRGQSVVAENEDEAIKAVEDGGLEPVNEEVTDYNLQSGPEIEAVNDDVENDLGPVICPCCGAHLLPL